MNFVSKVGKINLNSVSNGNIGNASEIFENGFRVKTDKQNVDSYENIDYNLEIDIKKNIDSSKEKKKWYEKIADLYTNALATEVVGFTSVLSGALNVTESIVDGGAWVVSSIGSALGLDTTGIKEFIATDLVSEANDKFYKETKFGSLINDKSYMKYESKAAKGIRKATETVTEFAAATALTAASGGTLTFALGAISGAGKAAEQTYQQNADTDLFDELKIGGAGLLTGLSWAANGKLGNGFWEIGKTAAETSTKETISTLAKEFVSKDNVTKMLKEGLASKNAIMNYVGSGLQLGGDASEYLTGAKEFNSKECVKLVGKYGLYLGLNVLEDGARDYVSVFNASDVIKNINTPPNKVMAPRPYDGRSMDQNTLEENLLEIMQRHDTKYGSGDAFKRLQEFLDPSSSNYRNYNLISSSDDARNLLKNYTFEQIRHSFENLYDSKSFSNFFTEYGNSALETYGVDQGGIASLCEYSYNGVKYNYRQAMDIVNNAVKNGQPVPYFEKEGLLEYFKLKEKLINQGFSSKDASIIMSTVDDAGACSYASTANEIFTAFRGRENDFYNKFGYEMYKLQPDGQKVLNSNELLLDLYCECNKKSNGGSFILDNNTLNPNFITDRRVDVFGRKMLDASNQEYMSEFYSGKNTAAIQKFLYCKGVNYSSNWVVSNQAKRIDYNFLNDAYSELNNGKSLTLDIFSYGNEINMVSSNPNLYSSVSTNSWNEGVGHSVFVTGMSQDCFYVSSWGQEYSIPYSDLANGGMFNLYSATIN